MVDWCVDFGYFDFLVVVLLIVLVVWLCVYVMFLLGYCVLMVSLYICLV